MTLDSGEPADALDLSDRELDRALSAAEKLSQALEMMSAGIRLRRVALRERFPEADELDIEQRLTAWLTEDD